VRSLERSDERKNDKGEKKPIGKREFTGTARIGEGKLKGLAKSRRRKKSRGSSLIVEQKGGVEMGPNAR